MENNVFRRYVVIALLSILMGILLVGCTPETPGNYVAGTTPITDVNNWQAQYNNGGTLPSWTAGPTNNELVGTTWVLTRVMSGFASTYPNDTIRFIDNTNYTLNNGANRPYQLSSGVASTNKTLSLYFFQPFGGSHYSGQVGYYFVSDAAISNIEFHNIQNTTSTVKAWFTKI